MLALGLAAGAAAGWFVAGCGVAAAGGVALAADLFLAKSAKGSAVTALAAGGGVAGAPLAGAAPSAAPSGAAAGLA